MLQVGTDARLYGHDGKRVYLRGVHLFQSTFSLVGDGYRANWARRYSQPSGGGGGGGDPGHSAPVYSSPQSWLSQTYVDDATCYANFVKLKKLNFNTVRFYVDQAFYQTAPFTDSVTLTDFQSEPDIAMNIIRFCKELGMYVVISYDYASTPDTDAIAFWAWMGDYYKDCDNVIFEIQSETGSNQQKVFTGQFTGVIAGASLTASTVYGTIVLGGKISAAGVDAATVVVSQTSGTTGGAGVYVVSVSQTVASETMTAYRSYGDVFDLPNWTDTRTPTSTGIAAYNARVGGMVTAIRGAGFRGVIAVSPLCNLWNIDTIISSLTDPDQPFLTDPNLSVEIHTYYFYQNTPTDFSVTLPGLTSGVTNYANDWCIINTEFGFTNNPIGSAPPFDPGAPTDAALLWDQTCASWSMQEYINGSVFFCMQPGQPDNYNDIFDATTGFITTWGAAITEYNTFAGDHLATFIPQVISMTGSLTSYAGTIMKWRRDGKRVDCRLVLITPTNGTASGVLLVQLPARAPCNGYQTFTGHKADGTPVKIMVIGEYAEITNFNDTYPGADGLHVYADFTYYCQGSGFNYDTMSFANDHWLLRGANLTGLSDGKAGTAAFTLEMTGGDGAQMRILTTNQAHWTIFRRTDNKLQAQFRNAANTIIGVVVSTTTHTVASGKHAVYVAWDLAASHMFMYVDGVDVSSTVTATNDTIDYTDSNVGVGATIAGGEKLQANMEFLWFNDTYLTPVSTAGAANLAKFFDYKNKAIDLGHFGDRPIGALPKIFLRQLDSVGTRSTNNGTGGGFTNNI